MRKSQGDIVMIVVSVLLILLVVFVALWGLTQFVPSTKLGKEAYMQAQERFVVATCKTWVDSLGLEIAYPTNMEEMISAASLDWNEFCSKEAIKDPQLRCRCIKACVKSLEAEQFCKSNPNSFKIDLWSPDGETKKGTVTDSLGTYSDVDESMAPTYCFLERLRSMSTLTPSCALNEGGFVAATLSLSDLSTDKRSFKASCETTCRNPEGCDAISLSMEYSCKVLRRAFVAATERNYDGSHCCLRKPYTYVTDKNCLGGDSSCGSVGPSSPPEDLTKEERARWERVRTSPTTFVCDRTEYGASCSHEFSITAAPGDFNAPSSLLWENTGGWKDVETYSMRCAVDYSGAVYKSNEAAMKVGPEGSGEKFRNVLCIPTGGGFSCPQFTGFTSNTPEESACPA